MNRGLLEKTVREVFLGTLAYGGAALTTEALLAYVLPTLQPEIASAWLRIGFIQGFLKAMLGTQVGDSVGPGVFIAMPWVHPVLLAILWAHQITFSTRMPVAEVERGTIDVLLGQPVSRLEVYGHESAVWLLSGLALVAMTALGNFLGAYAARQDTFVPAGRLLPLLGNLYCLSIAVGGIGYLLSTLSDMRGRAIGWALAVVLASFLLNFLAQFWEAAHRVSFLSLMTYYRPADILGGERWPWADMGVLLAVGAATWAAGAVVFRHRDIRTV
jgi:ABC-2 type transport system permease protein